MSEMYTITNEKRFLVIRFLSEPKFEHVIQAIDDVSENYNPKKRLWVLSKGLNLTSAKMIEIGNHGKVKFSAPAQSAIVVPDDLAFGLVRVQGVYREDGIVDERLFRTEEEAREWLAKD